jgi:hypothetical protein
MPAEPKTFTIEGAELAFLNFAGREGRYNDKGDRNFCIILPEPLAEQLAADGWNIKSLRSRDEDAPDRPYIQVKVDFNYYKPPRVTMISSTGRTNLDKDTVEIIDSVDILNVDVMVRGYDWETPDKKGTKAYLQTMFVTIQEDELERKYAAMEG